MSGIIREHIWTRQEESSTYNPLLSIAISTVFTCSVIILIIQNEIAELKKTNQRKFLFRFFGDIHDQTT